jgi:hypothetical protein
MREERFGKVWDADNGRGVCGWEYEKRAWGCREVLRGTGGGECDGYEEEVWRTESVRRG